MAYNSLPAELQNIIQTGYLARAFQDSLHARIGFRAIAKREEFPNGIGDTYTASRPGLRLPSITPLANVESSDLDSGLTAHTSTVEQWTATVARYGDLAKSNLHGEITAIKSKWLMDASKMGEQARTSIDMLARNKLFDAYMGGNTRVRTTLGSAGPALAVFDVRGFAANDVVAVNGSPYTVVSVAVDGTNASDTGGVSGVITFSSNVSTANGTVGNVVLNAKAPKIIRAGGRASSNLLTGSDLLSLDMLLLAVTEMRMNAVPDIDGYYNLYLSPAHAAALMSDSKFLNAFNGAYGANEIRTGAISDIYGVRLIQTNLNEAFGGMNRAILVGKGALVESTFVKTAYGNQADLRSSGEVSIVDDVAYVISEPADALKAWAKQAWHYIGGFSVPTDSGTNNQVIPTATSAAYKRAIVLESK